MAGFIFDWDTLRETFVSGTMRLRSLSREETGDPNSPKYQRLGQKAREENWKKLRDDRQKGTALIESDRVQIEAELAAPIGSHNLTHYSTDLPDHLKERYSQAVTDPNLMAMRQDIAVINSLIANKLRQMGAGDISALHWKRMRKTATELMAASRSNDRTLSAEKTNELVRLIARGCPEVELQNELIALMENRMKLINAESKRLHLLQQYVAREDALSHARLFAEAVKKHVHDPETLSNLAAEFKRIRLGFSKPN